MTVKAGPQDNICAVSLESNKSRLEKNSRRARRISLRKISAADTLYDRLTVWKNTKIHKTLNRMV